MNIVLIELCLAEILPVRLQFPILMPFDYFLSHKVETAVIACSIC